MRYRAPIIALSLMFAATTTAQSAEKSAGTGLGAGKVSLQDIHFTKRSEAVSKCPGGSVADQADGSFACSSSSPEASGMAINEKGTSGTKPKPSTPK